jgi:hypothetical protein
MDHPQIEAGTYSAVVQDVWLGVSRGGTDYIAVRFATSPGELNGGEITWYGYLSEKAAPYTLKNLRTLGWQGTMIGELDKRPELIPSPVDIVCEEEEYQGTTSTRVRWINRPRAPRSAGGQADISKRLEALAKASLAESAKPKAPPPGRHRTIADGDDDLPY